MNKVQLRGLTFSGFAGERKREKDLSEPFSFPYLAEHVVLPRF